LNNQPFGIEDTDDDGFGARLIIDLDALADNWRTMGEYSSPARCAAVVKADGYGLGIEQVTATLYGAGCRDFFVATAREGVVVRQHAADARIYVMNCILPGIEAACRAADLVPVLASMEHVAIWTQSCIENGEHPCALQVDTGMHRLGISVGEAELLANDVTRPAGFSPVHIMSHLACSDEPDHPLNLEQRDRFGDLMAAFGGIEASLSNSAGILLGSGYRFDVTRPGIALYGGKASAKHDDRIKPVVTAQTRIITIRHARAGDTVGYGAAATLHRDSRLAVCSVGYGDGYMRAVSGAGTPSRDGGTKGACGFAGGHYLPVVGRITMDLTVFDITDLPDGSMRPGNFIELFGHDVLLDDVAATGGTIGYELLTSLGTRYRRHYVHPLTGGTG
jgi:alanine racemase